MPLMSIFLLFQDVVKKKTDACRWTLDTCLISEFTSIKQRASSIMYLIYQFLIFIFKQK